MFQTFDTPESRPTGSRIAALRQHMERLGIDAVLVPRADEHQGEYVPPSAERLRWLTGFSGSAGLAVVTRTSAALIVDGRYTVQVRAETDGGLFQYPDIQRGNLVDWLSGHLAEGARIGFDPWLHTAGEIARLGEACDRAGLGLKPLSRNPVDHIWGRERPAPPAGRITPHALKYAGRTAAEKITDVQAKLKQDGHDAVVLTLPDSIAWLFNIRGCDVAHNPVALAFAIVPLSGKPEVFVAPEKLDAAARAHLEPVARLFTPQALKARIAALKATGKRVRLDTATAAYALFRALGGAKTIARDPDPCIALKARKTSAEIAGARAAHQRDGVAVTRFLAWLSREAAALDARAKDGLDEIAAVRRLEDLRRDTGALRDISFDTISGSGANGAIVHYRVSEATNRRLRSGELFLIDSGGQYIDGTTDITRTVAIGTPTAEMRRRFTLVLKGHIAIATARFPKGTRGIDLDPFARRALWEHGLDYDHGTGHGIGSYLSVHEGPQSISRAGMAVLEPGMLVSNEPGFYKTGAYGIRIENVVLVSEPEIPVGGERPMMAFETLTLAPIDRTLIAPDLLSPAEVAWLDAYHARVRKALGPELGTTDRAWLTAATRPLG